MNTLQFDKALARGKQKELAVVDKSYSLQRLLNALQMNEVARLAPYELDCSDAIAAGLGRLPSPGYLFVPHEAERDLTVASGPSAGFLAQTDAGPGNLFLHHLHASLGRIFQWVSRLALVNNASIPSVAGTVTSSWQNSEGSPLSESQISFAVSASTPKTVGAYVELSDKLLKQVSSYAQDFIMRILGRAVAAELYGKLLSGTGTSGEITGVMNTAGIGSVSGTSLDYAAILNVVKTIEDLSALVDPLKAGFVSATDVARLLRAREKAVGSGMIMTANDLAGYPAVSTKAASDGTLIFGDWSQLLLIEFGVLEIGTDPYGMNSALFIKGLTGLRAIWSVDTLVLHPSSFVKVTSIT